MGKIQSITSKSDLMSKAIELQNLAGSLNERVMNLQNRLSTTKNYDDTIDISSKANILANNFVKVSNNISMSVLNIRKYISDVIEFDKFDLDIDRELTNENIIK